MLTPAIIILLVTLTLVIITFLLYSIYSIYTLIPSVSGAPYVPSSDEKLAKAIKLAQVKPGMKVVDLGSGDGKVLLEFANLGCQVHGYEINPFLVLRSRRAIKKNNLQDKAFAYWKNFWKQDLSLFDLVFVYGVSNIMKGLSKKLQKELKAGTKVVSITYPLPGWECTDSATSVAYTGSGRENSGKLDNIYLYVK